MFTETTVRKLTLEQIFFLKMDPVITDYNIVCFDTPMLLRISVSWTINLETWKYFLTTTHRNIFITT